MVHEESISKIYRTGTLGLDDEFIKPLSVVPSHNMKKIEIREIPNDELFFHLKKKKKRVASHKR